MLVKTRGSDLRSSDIIDKLAMKMLANWKSSHRVLISIFACLILFNPSSVLSQGIVLNLIQPENPVEGSPLVVKAPVRSLQEITGAMLFYRDASTADYKQVEMTLDGNTISLIGTIPSSDVVQPYVEVYVRVNLRNGATETYPSSDPTNNPVRIVVAASPEKQSILILSPDPGQRVSPDEFLISVSLLYAPSFVDRNKTEVFLDNDNVTGQTVVSGNIVVYSPQQMPAGLKKGVHKVRVVLFDSKGKAVSEKSWDFSVVSPEEQIATSEAFLYHGMGRIELRNESISGVSTWYNRGDVNLEGSYGILNASSLIHLSSEEKSYRQPQDRYGVTVGIPWVKLNLGDSYPIFNSLVMNGQRVRGISGRVSAGFLTLDAAYGQTVRGINGTYLDTIHLVSSFSFDTSGAALTKINDSTYVRTNYGVYARNLFAIRPAFNFGNVVELGLIYLKSSDEAGSISIGKFPNQNAVLGSDFAVNLDNRKIQLRAEAALSMLNQNILVGNRSKADIDSITHSTVGEDIDKIIPLSTLSQFITLNEYLIPLDPTRLSSLAWDVNLSLNYFNTFARIGYIYRGPDYVSFGQPYIRTNIRGLNFFLRPRLMSNQLLLTIGYEDLFDNLQKNQFATTEYSTFNLAVSYYPYSNLPGVTFGFSSFANENSLPVDSTYSVNNLTLRYYVEASYSFNLYFRHSMIVSFGTTNRRDRVKYGVDLSNTNFSLMLNSDLGQTPLRTTVGINVNNNSNNPKIGTGTTFNYTSLIFGLNYQIADGRVNIGMSFNPTFGDFTRGGYSLTAAYRVSERHSLDFVTNYFTVGDTRDVIGSLVYSFNF
ncbi:MAG: hypothetical protein ACP5US_11155 [Candidatus Kryptoniota bacterium]